MHPSALGMQIASGGVFSNKALLSAMYYYIIFNITNITTFNIMMITQHLLRPGMSWKEELREHFNVIDSLPGDSMEVRVLPFN